MPNTTPNFGLPYPSGSDAPCDFAEQWCDFTDAVNAVMDRFQSGIDRAYPVVPAALVKLTTIRGVAPNNPIPFDQVVLDTAGMTDLDADPYHIRIPRPGRYVQGLMIEKPTSTVVNSIFESLGTNVFNQILDRGPGFFYFNPVFNTIGSYAAGDLLDITFLSLGAPIVVENIDSAWFSIVWHSDTEAPA